MTFLRNLAVRIRDVPLIDSITQRNLRFPQRLRRMRWD